MGDPREDKDAPGLPDGGLSMTDQMNRVTRGVTGERPPLGERTRLAWRVVRPYWNRTAWWIMLGIAILVVGLDLNSRFDGFIGNSIEWVRTNVMASYPSIAFIMGMVACYYLVMKARGGRGV